MTIPAAYSDKYFFHFTHIENLESIVREGLLCTNIKKNRGIEHVNVAAGSIQERRSQMKVPTGPKGTVHDYVPFYLTSVNPMFLALINSKNIDQQFIVFLAIPISKILEPHVVFTDASANTDIPPNFYSEAEDLSKLDWDLISTKKWARGTSDELHRRMAEVLIYERVDIREIDTIIVWNDSIKDEVYKIFDKNKVERPKIDFSPFKNKYTFHFTKFMVNEERSSLVTGPFFLKRSYQNAIKVIKESRSKITSDTVFPFQSLKELLLELEEDFCAIKELEGIFELETDNKMHNENVSDHTLRVVEELEKLDTYKQHSSVDRDILKISAYLHDIGKGPKSKWADGIQTVYPDHPADAPEMLERILSEDIKEISDEEIEMICLLVTYHDLIGEIIGKGRNIEQLFDIIKSEKEFEMLSTLNLADVNAIGGFFTWSYKSGIKNIKTQVLDKLAK